MLINGDKKYCYRICHIHNLPHILEVGICSKNHPKADPNFIAIGNPSIINSRSTTPVKISGYGNIGEYVPFYFTPRSIMLYNIVTGHWVPLVPKIPKEDIIIFCCEINALVTLPYFFTDGQANDEFTKHYNDIREGNNIDWHNIQNGNFSKNDGDFDRPRRYQAEFLVRHHVPVNSVASIFVYNDKAGIFVKSELTKAGITLNVSIKASYFFN